MACSIGIRWAGAALLAAAACGGPSDGDGGDGSSTAAGSTSTSTSAAVDSTIAATTGSGGSTSTGGPITAGSSDEAGPGDSTGAGLRCAGTFPAAWQDGTDCASETPWQIHAYDDDTVILRQTLCSNFEGPFLYLLFGQERVLLQDTGTGHEAIAPVVDSIIDDWLAAHGRASIELVVTNSHGHGDHVGGNGEFVGRPNTTVVGFSQPDVASFFGISNWPEDIVQYDLGGRVLDIVPIPGHQSAHIAIYDHGAGVLLTGDTLYPGRLYIDDWPDYVASIHRLVDHTASLEVCDVLGTHIEMTNTPGVDFPFGADAHPDEHPLALSYDHLVELRDAVDAMGPTPSIEAHDDFIIYPL